MEKTRNNNGIWIFCAALTLGICLVIAAIITTLPELLGDTLATSVNTMPVSQAPATQVLPPLTGINESFAEDKTEGKSPDFRKLIVSYDETTVYVTIVFNSGVDKVGAADYLYLYGTHHDMLRLGAGSFTLERDGGPDGHFEELVYSGSIKKLSTDALSMEIPRKYLPDIAEKVVWIYSMQSQDRLPDKGGLLMPDAVPLE